MKTIASTIPVVPSRTAILSVGAARCALCAVLALWLSSTGFAQTANPPDLMSYQGYVVDANGNPLATNNPVNYTIVFRIYSTSTGGTSLWTESQTVTVDRGNISVVLGEGVSVGSEARPSISSIFSSANASDRYLGITVKGLTGGDPEIAPRLRLLPAPYAFLAKAATALVAPDGSGLLLTDNGRMKFSQSLQSTGGNTRGQGATDLQTVRSSTAPSQVASGDYSTISGGQNNQASGLSSTISGGANNLVSGSYAVVAGGSGNNAEGSYSVVPGGLNNYAKGQYSLAAGRRARAMYDGSMVLGDSGDSDKSATAPDQLYVSMKGGVFINATPETGTGVSFKTGGTMKAEQAQFTSVTVNGAVTASSLSGFGTIPVGGIIMWSGAVSDIPNGWALCNGQSSNGRITPNLQNKFIVGIGNRNPGDTGGAETVTLSIDQLPSHNHTGSGTTGNAGTHNHSFADYYFAEKGGLGNNNLRGSGSSDNDNGLWAVENQTRDAGDHTHTFSFTTTSTGGGKSVPTLPPFYALAYIMRVQ